MSSSPLAAARLDQLFEADDFRAIWCKATWLSDALELRRDHVALRGLVQMVSCARSVDEIESPLHTAVDLFKLHAAIEQRLLPGFDAATWVEHVLMVLEQLEDTDPEDPLHVVQTTHLRFHMGALIQRESEVFEQLGERRSAELLEDDVLRYRSELLRTASRLLESDADARAPQLERPRQAE